MYSEEVDWPIVENRGAYVREKRGNKKNMI